MSTISCFDCHSLRRGRSIIWKEYSRGIKVKAHPSVSKLVRTCELNQADILPEHNREGVIILCRSLIKDVRGMSTATFLSKGTKEDQKQSTQQTRAEGRQTVQFLMVTSPEDVDTDGSRTYR